MGNRQNCAKFQENLFKSNEIISIFCPPLFRKRPIPTQQRNPNWIGYFIKIIVCRICYFLYRNTCVHINKIDLTMHNPLTVTDVTLLKSHGVVHMYFLQDISTFQLH